MHEASASGNHQLVTELLNNGALIDQRDTQGMTALHIAASHGSTKCVRVLIEKGKQEQFQIIRYHYRIRCRLSA